MSSTVELTLCLCSKILNCGMSFDPTALGLTHVAIIVKLNHACGLQDECSGHLVTQIS